MTQTNHYTRGEFIHLAECAAQLAEAVAVSIEAGGEDGIDLAAAMAAIPDAHMCHLDAAVVMMVMLIKNGGGSLDEWRDSIPDLVAFIVGQPAV